LEKVYGSGIISWYTGLETEPTVGSIFAQSGLKLFSLFLTYKMGKYIFGRFRKNNMLSK
jgi:hypothetical protein